jgi:Flp pilus assembly protein TadD
MALKSGTFALAGALAASLAFAPGAPVAAQAVVQAVPPPGLGELQAALRILAREPQNQPALLRAAWASIELEDYTAAEGYLRRAEAVNPANGEVSAGLATLALRQGNPVAAIRLFAQAEAQGAPMAPYAGNRGLALDLVGSNVAAQGFYRQALQFANEPETVRRLALSQAIVGDLQGSEATLLPLLQRSDLAAYRTRAFALAIAGKGEEAVSIAQTMLPATLSNRMAPYLRYMPRLTRAQQAAAANLGRFPPAAEIGRDSPEIAAIAGQDAPQVAAARTADSRLEPAGEPLGAGNRESRRRDRNRRDQEPRVQGGTLEVTYTPIKQPAAQPEPAPQPSSSVGEPIAATPQPVEPPPAPPSLAEAFADFSLPPSEVVPAAGAVDITRIDPPRERVAQPVAKPAAKPPAPKPPAHPRRFWVQVATGRDADALKWDWRRIKREGGDLLASKDAFSARWGQANRLLTGPYPSAAAAQQAVTALKAKGLDSFTFTSAEGEVVSPLR